MWLFNKLYMLWKYYRFLYYTFANLRQPLHLQESQDNLSFSWIFFLFFTFPWYWTGTLASAFPGFPANPDSSPPVHTHTHSSPLPCVTSFSGRPNLICAFTGRLTKPLLWLSQHSLCARQRNCALTQTAPQYNLLLSFKHKKKLSESLEWFAVFSLSLSHCLQLVLHPQLFINWTLMSFTVSLKIKCNPAQMWQMEKNRQIWNWTT